MNFTSLRSSRFPALLEIMRLAGPADTGSDVLVPGIYLYLATCSVPSNTQVATAKLICGTQAALPVLECIDQ